MTQAQPTHLAQAAEQAAPTETCWCAGQMCSGCATKTEKLWMRACEWLYTHLLTTAPEFDEGVAAEKAWQWDKPPWTSTPLRELAFAAGARWQHAQTQAQVAALRAELDSAYETLGTKAKEWATGELDRLRAEVERLKECEANFKLTAELQDAAIKDFNAILKLAEQMAGALEWIAAHTFGDVKLEASKHLAAWREFGGKK